MEEAEHVVDFFGQPKPLLSAFGIFLTLLVGVIDYLTGFHISVSVFYLGPICFVTWFVSKRAGIFVSMLSIEEILHKADDLMYAVKKGKKDSINHEICR